MSLPKSWLSAILTVFCCGLPAFSQILANRYTLVLQDPPVAARFVARGETVSPQALSYRQQIDAKQAALRSELAARHIQVTSSTSLLVNAVFVNAPGHSIDELRALPGVAEVVPMRTFKPTLNRAATLMNAQAAWTALGGVANAGKGVKIGILDSGIELTNPAFQDSSLSMPSGYPKCNNSSADVWTCASFTNSKVIAARSYVRLVAAGSDPNNPAADSMPDDYSPRDRLGHGTAVAMSAAGNTIATPATATDGSSISIQGMAPKAYLGNYKIAGTYLPATDETMIQAVGDAVQDGMDVITTSWGSIAMGTWNSDPVATAFENAAKAGPVVIASAGNDGADGYYYGYQYPNFNSISSPSNAPDVISVGASLNSHYMTPSVSINAASAPASLKAIPAIAGSSYFLPSAYGANTAPLVDITSLDSTSLACNPLPANSLTGAFALILRGTCTFDTKAANAQAAGAVGFIFYMATSSSTVGASDSNENGPTASISNAAGLALKSYLASNPGSSVTIDVAGIESDLTSLNQSLASGGYSAVAANQVASFSSFGPTPEGLIKPDLIATGGIDSPAGTVGGIYTITQTYDPEGEFYSSNGFMAADGTSLAAPITAGVAAMVKQAHPSLTGIQIRSLLVNSTATSVTTDDFGDPVDVEWIGAGLLNAGAAVQASVTAEPATVSFGVLNGATLPKSQIIKLTNTSSGSVTLAATVACCSVNGTSGGTLSGATVAVSSSSVTLAAGANTNLTVSLSGAVPAAGEYSGSINLQASNTSLHIPFMLLVGDGAAYNITPIGIVPESISFEGVPGTDMNVSYPMLQVTDKFGAPVANSPVTFGVGRGGNVTLKSSTQPGAPACTPATSTSTISCPTDQYGFAWMDIVLGSQVSQPTINFSSGSNSDYFYANIQAAPTITAGGVVDAVSYKTPIVPGSYVSIFGNNLEDPPADRFSTQCPTGPCVAPLQFDGVSVSFDVPSAGISAPASFYYVSPTQINIQVPWELQGQTSAQVKVTLYGDLIGNVVTVPIASYSPVLFYYGTNTAIAQDTEQNPWQLITTAAPAKRGHLIVLYANGLGPVNNQPNTGVPATDASTSTKQQATVTIGGQNATVLFSGLVPGTVGLYQINVRVPDGSSTGNAVPVSVSIGGVTTPAATLPVQ
jgi:minor extracellular serine protease Vpr